MDVHVLDFLAFRESWVSMFAFATSVYFEAIVGVRISAHWVSKFCNHVHSIAPLSASKRFVDSTNFGSRRQTSTSSNSGRLGARALYLNMPAASA